MCKNTDGQQDKDPIVNGLEDKDQIANGQEANTQGTILIGRQLEDGYIKPTDYSTTPCIGAGGGNYYTVRIRAVDGAGVPISGATEDTQTNDGDAQ